ncbi:MAG: efflux transporter outer membrane subunit, partial [Anaerohalosphaera sp.]|nr:efflux transporter outer membrane subunit [Anaerohalosphaera sp.]
MTKTLTTLVSCTIIAMLTGCTLGPDYVRPRTPAHDTEAFDNLPSSWKETKIAENVEPWWQRFADPVTADLVTIALKNNNDIKAAAARVLESEQMLNQAHGVRLPSVSYSASRYRGKSVFASPAGSSSFLATNYSHDLSVSYMVDLFGKLKRAEQAALQELYATESARQALTHAIVAQVVSLRTQIATLQRLTSIAEATIISRQQTLDTVDRRYNEGLVNSVEIYLARENLAAAKSSIPQLRQSLALTQNSLDVLLGRSPGSSDELAETLPDLPDLSPIPSGLPVDLLDRRPDLMQAEFRLAAATERIGISIAQMLPDFTLTASGGYRSESFRLLTATENQVYSAAVALAAPIFQGGRLKAGIEAA